VLLVEPLRGLARREITAMLRDLHARVPDFRAVDQPDYPRSGVINGIKRLPQAFGEF